MLVLIDAKLAKGVVIQKEVLLTKLSGWVTCKGVATGFNHAVSEGVEIGTTETAIAIAIGATSSRPAKSGGRIIVANIIAGKVVVPSLAFISFIIALIRDQTIGLFVGGTKRTAAFSDTVIGV